MSSPVALTGTHDTSPVALTGVVDVWTGEILDPALNFSKALNSQYLGAI